MNAWFIYIVLQPHTCHRFDCRGHDNRSEEHRGGREATCFFADSQSYMAEDSTA